MNRSFLFVGMAFVLASSACESTSTLLGPSPDDVRKPGIISSYDPAREDQQSVPTPSTQSIITVETAWGGVYILACPPSCQR